MNLFLVLCIAFIALTVLCPVKTSCEQFYIVPSTNHSSLCPSQPCLTLNQYAENASEYNYSNMTLILLEGNHSLEYELSITNLTEISISAQQGDTVTITCSYPGKLVVADVDYLYINMVSFYDCGSEVLSVDLFLVEDSMFASGTETALLLHETNAEIRNVNISEYSLSPEDQGGAISCNHSTVQIYNVVFEGNTAGDGGAIYIESESTVTIAKSSFKLNSAVSGGAISAYSESSITLESCDFNANGFTETNRGGVLLLNQSLLMVINCSFENNQANSGAVLFTQSQSNISISKSFFTNNNATASGGVVYSEGRATFAVHFSTFDGNTASEGGGAFFLTQSNLTISTCFFRGNRAGQGGVIHKQLAGNIFILNSTFLDNVAQSTGGVLNADRETYIEIIDSVFQFNTCPTGGVLTALLNSDITVDSSEFSNNGILTSNTYGGVFVISESRIDINNSTFTNNSAYAGGSLLFGQCNSHITNSTFSNSRAIVGGSLLTVNSSLSIVNSNFHENQAYIGGAITAWRQTNVSINNSSFANNRVDVNGGVVYADGKSSLSVELSEFAGNTALGRGGAFFLADCNLTIRTSTFERSTAPRGGVIETQLAGNISITNSTFQNNLANQGGVINAEDLDTTNINIITSSFSNNTCPVGGVVYAANNSTVMVDSSQFRSNGMAINSQSMSEGGVFVIRQSGVVITACIFVSNGAFYGGAFHFFQANSVITSSTFSSNTGRYSGGVLFDEQSYVSIQSCEFDNNIASVNGGVLHFSGSNGTQSTELQSNVSINNSNFANNRAYMNGGVVYAEGRISFTVDFSEFDSNAAFIGRGGAFFLSDCNLTISTSTFERSTAPRGGVIETQLAGNISVTNSTFQNNFANQGGVINAEDTTNINIITSSFSNNTCPVGGVVYAANNSTVMVDSSQFRSNGILLDSQSISAGGVFVIRQSRVVITACTFVSNGAFYGGAFHFFQADSVITSSTFSSNTGHHSGGVLFDEQSYVSIQSCEFDNNTAETYGGVLYFSGSNSAASTNNGISKYIDYNNTYYRNSAYIGGAVYIWNLKAAIQNSRFNENKAYYLGGAIVLYYGHINTTIANNVFAKNTAQRFGGALILRFTASGTVSSNVFHDNEAPLGGALYVIDCSLFINTNMFYNNYADSIGGAIFGSNTQMALSNSSFHTNSAAASGGAIITFDCMNSFNDLTFMQNSGNAGIVTLFESETSLYGTTLFQNNVGSLTVIASTFTLLGNMQFTNGVSPNTTNPALPLKQGGAITLFQSILIVKLEGTFKLMNNSAETGGGIYATESRLILVGSIQVVDNKAGIFGGGAYLYQTEFTVRGDCTFERNTAKYGGAIYSLGSGITAAINAPNTVSPIRSYIFFRENKATHGGAVYLKGNAKLYTIKFRPEVLEYMNDGSNHLVTTNFTSNLADYGGAIYIDDQSTGICNSVLTDFQTTLSECPLQTLAVYDTTGNVTLSQVQYKNTYFTNNSAMLSGDNIFGGLFDRCTMSPLAEIVRFNETYEDLDGISYLHILSNTHREEAIGSRPVRVCLCENGYPNCGSNLSRMYVKKGESFSISVVAVDQIDNPMNSTFQTYLSASKGKLSEEDTSTENSICTDLGFSISSPNDVETLFVYSIGPCNDAPLSRMEIEVLFLQCDCSVGFMRTENERVCECVCDSLVTIHTSICNSTTETFIKSDNSWIGFVYEDDPDSLSVHLNCPYNYCKPSGSTISFSNSTICNFNRKGILCGACTDTYSLSLGTSLCLICPNYWPWTLVTIVAMALISGIILVIVSLVLNITVAVGTINAIVFYANIIASNYSSFFPGMENGFQPVFSAWLNLNFGLNVCLFEGMDEYMKTWLKMLFPAYIIIIVAIIILVSEYSPKFAKVISMRNPVATLATLILLSYTTFLQVTISALAFTVMDFPDGSRVPVWLPDGNIKYLQGKHIALFIAAIIILLIGISYTLLLFSWQWLVQYSDKKVFHWIAEKCKIRPFVEVYLAPYKDKHRYWTGLLLVVRVFLYLISFTNVTGDPQIQLVSVVIVIGCLILLKSIIIEGVYKSWPVDVLESIILFNILAFGALTMYSTAVNPGSQSAIAMTSTIITTIVLLIVIIYHVYAYILKPCGMKSPKEVFNRCFRRRQTNLQQIRQIISVNENPVNSNTDTGRFHDILCMMTPPGTLDYEVQRRSPTNRSQGATRSSLVLPEPNGDPLQIEMNSSTSSPHEKQSSNQSDEQSA